MEGDLFVEQRRTGKMTGNVASAQNGCARPAVSMQNVTIAGNNHTRAHWHLCSKYYFLVFKHFKYFTLYN